MEKKLTEERVNKLAAKTRINPSIIWETKKRTQQTSDLDYNTVTESGEIVTDPEKAKEHTASYFEDLYQARPGTKQYEKWTKHISETMDECTRNHQPEQISQGSEPITRKELNTAIKKLKRKKSIGPDQIPNEAFIEADQETREIYREVFNNIHKHEDIPEPWQMGHIKRLYKGKGKKGKCSNERGITLASNSGKVFERIMNERIKKEVKMTPAQGGGIKGCATVDHLIVLKEMMWKIKRQEHRYPMNNPSAMNNQ